MLFYSFIIFNNNLLCACYIPGNTDTMSRGKRHLCSWDLIQMGEYSLYPEQGGK